MIRTVDTSLAGWEVDPRDDPRFVGCAQRLIAAAAALGGQSETLVMHIDNWFGVRWLGFPQVHLQVRGGLHGVRRKKVREPDYHVPPFHPNRVLSEKRYELNGDGVLLGPSVPPRTLHRLYEGNEESRMQSFKEVCEPGVYAWYSGNTQARDRASLMVYTHGACGTSAWYVEFRKAAGWRLFRRTCVGHADWQRLLEAGGVTELE